MNWEFLEPIVVTLGVLYGLFERYKRRKATLRERRTAEDHKRFLRIHFDLIERYERKEEELLGAIKAFEEQELAILSGMAADERRPPEEI